MLNLSRIQDDQGWLVNMFQDVSIIIDIYLLHLSFSGNLMVQYI